MVVIMSFTWIPIPQIFTSKFISNQGQSCNNGEMAPLSRFELLGSEMVEANLKVAALFGKIGWGLFFIRFSGHHYEITRQFTFSLKEDVAQVGGFHITVNENKIAEATGLPQIGEHWFKGEKVNKVKCMSLLLPLPAGSNLTNGVSVKYLEPEW